MGCKPWHEGHPSVNFGDSSPQGEPPSTPVEFIRPRRGQSVGRRKSVKKNAALLHFLAFSSNDYLFGVLRGERLAAHNERRQFAAQTRSCGYSPRWGEHCSLPRFAALNCGPLLATPQSPKPGSAALEQRDFFRFLFWSQKRKNSRKDSVHPSAPPQGGGKCQRAQIYQKRRTRNLPKFAFSNVIPSITPH